MQMVPVNLQRVQKAPGSVQFGEFYYFQNSEHQDVTIQRVRLQEFLTVL